MKQILFNLALIHLMKFCAAASIDCSGSHVEKAARGFQYNLIRDTDGKLLAAVTFHKSSVPTYQSTL